MMEVDPADTRNLINCYYLHDELRCLPQAHYIDTGTPIACAFGVRYSMRTIGPPGLRLRMLTSAWAKPDV